VKFGLSSKFKMFETAHGGENSDLGVGMGWEWGLLKKVLLKENHNNFYPSRK
jgi:hypothetical protein